MQESHDIEKWEPLGWRMFTDFMKKAPKDRSGLLINVSS